MTGETTTGDDTGTPRPDPSAGDPSAGNEAGAPTGEPSREAEHPRRRGPFRRREYSPEEVEAAKQAWRDVRPWDGPMTRGDKILVFSTLGVLVLMLVSLPLRPFLLASHPVALSAVTGSLSAIGAGAAFARIGETELWLVVLAGVFGMIKFDWLFWLAGRRWGEKIVTLFAPGERAQGFVSRVRSWPPWALPLAVVAAALPGIPSAAVFAVAGLGRMRLATFLLVDAIGAALITGLVAGLGFGLGQNAVDVVLTIDRYALWISLALIVFVAWKSGRRNPTQAGPGGAPAG
ncbi:VTT domain-containing protein [Pseudonocardia nematodicida]|uniref:VTT domain-containing protein n=1 Tax=Pseudonocardia nematodicida TaxID=1206997 RepID=A0ABV1K6J7_9PSEU